MSLIRVAVIGGGATPEHEVGRASARSVMGALAPDRYRPIGFTIASDGAWLNASDEAYPSFAAAMADLHSCEVAFPAVHGAPGEDGALAALFELAGMPYVGCDLAAGALAMDKQATKLIATSIDIATAPGTAVHSVDDVVDLALPVVVKPQSAGSSVGVSWVSEPTELQPAVNAALRVGAPALVESAIVGREVDIGVLEDADGQLAVGAPLEIVVADGVFDNVEKYDGSAQFVIPAPLTDDESAELTGAATRLFRALGCTGMARVDFFLTPDGPVLNEVNTMPGLTEHSQYPRMFAAAGISYPDLLDRLITTALHRHT